MRRPASDSARRIRGSRPLHAQDLVVDLDGRLLWYWSEFGKDPADDTSLYSASATMRGTLDEVHDTDLHPDGVVGDGRSRSGQASGDEPGPGPTGWDEPCCARAPGDVPVRSDKPGIPAAPSVNPRHPPFVGGRGL